MSAKVLPFKKPSLSTWAEQRDAPAKGVSQHLEDTHAANQAYKRANAATSKANKTGKADDHARAAKAHLEAAAMTKAIAEHPDTPAGHKSVWAARSDASKAAVSVHAAKGGVGKGAASGAANDTKGGGGDEYNRDDEGRFAPG